MARLYALGMAIILHTVMGVSYYFLLGKCSPAPLLGSWLFIACIVAVLQTICIFPQWCRNCSLLFQLAMETIICCLTLDLLLTKLWCRIEGLCHCAIIGLLQPWVTEERTFAMCEYWLLGLCTTAIGSCLLWLTLWATALPTKVCCSVNTWFIQMKQQMQGSVLSFVLKPDAMAAPKPEENEESSAE